MENVIIIGNGIAGITTARHIRKQSDKSITVISSETDYFYSRTALMYIYMGHMKFEHTKPYEDSFWKKNKIELIRGHVTQVDIKSQILVLSDGQKLSYDKLVLATGSKSNFFDWPGQNLAGVQGLYSYQDLELLEKNTRSINRAVVVGGGLIGVELAEMLHSRNIPVTFLVRESSFWNGVLGPGESLLINKEIERHHIDLRFSTSLNSIKGDKNNRVCSILTDKGEEIECQLVGITTGVSPNIDFLKNSGIELDIGILVNSFLETNIPNIYAVGDCAQQRIPLDLRKPVEAVWYTGRMMGEALAQTLCGRPTEYKPGYWFNSAKFFTIEYQTYGHVWARPKEYEKQLYWEHPDGRKCIRISFHKQSMAFFGINALGIRLRHECFDKWLREERSVDYVLSHLKEANFDPEFYKKHETDILNAFTSEVS